jgi:hypothetical protein
MIDLKKHGSPLLITLRQTKIAEQHHHVNLNNLSAPIHRLKVCLGYRCDHMMC